MYARLALAAAYYVLHKFQSPQISRKSLNNKRLGQKFRHWKKTRETTPLFFKNSRFDRYNLTNYFRLITNAGKLLKVQFSFLPRQKSKQSSQCLLITEKILLSETRKIWRFDCYNLTNFLRLITNSLGKAVKLKLLIGFPVKKINNHLSNCWKNYWKLV